MKKKGNAQKIIGQQGLIFNAASMHDWNNEKGYVRGSCNKELKSYSSSDHCVLSTSNLIPVNYTQKWLPSKKIHNHIIYDNSFLLTTNITYPNNNTTKTEVNITESHITYCVQFPNLE